MQKVTVLCLQVKCTLNRPTQATQCCFVAYERRLRVDAADESV